MSVVRMASLRDPHSPRSLSRRSAAPLDWQGDFVAAITAETATTIMKISTMHHSCPDTAERRVSAASYGAQDHGSEHGRPQWPELTAHPRGEVVGPFPLGVQLDGLGAGRIGAENGRLLRLGTDDKAGTAVWTYQAQVAVGEHTEASARSLAGL
jgi:hypothetical protein